ALLYFQAMGELHTQRWNRVGKDGSFANPQWVAFHKAVICEGFGRGEIQLLKISAADKTIGYVYSFIWRGTAYMLQSGFAHEEDNTKRPRIIAHCLAMQHTSLLGMHTYDYMCGDAEYKKSLAQSRPHLVWGRMQQKKPMLIFENALIHIGRAAKKAGLKIAPHHKKGSVPPGAPTKADMPTP